MMKIHEDLIDRNGDYLTHLFCCPIFIAGQSELIFAADSDLFNQDPTKLGIRNGTLTFVTYLEHIFGITCGHVVDTLINRRNIRAAEMKNTMAPGMVLPHDAQVHFFFPATNRYIHINSVFKREFRNDNDTVIDIAIAKISRDTWREIGRRALPLKPDPKVESFPDSFAGVATGYPEKLRGDFRFNNLLDYFTVPTVYAVAPIQWSENLIDMNAKLEVAPIVENYSGMSGGPIIWSHNNEWGLAGIVSDGSDIQDDLHVVKRNEITLYGVRIRQQHLIRWLDELLDDTPTKSLSQLIVFPREGPIKS